MAKSCSWSAWSISWGKHTMLKCVYSCQPWSIKQLMHGYLNPRNDQTSKQNSVFGANIQLRAGLNIWDPTYFILPHRPSLLLDLCCQFDSLVILLYHHLNCRSPKNNRYTIVKTCWNQDPHTPSTSLHPIFTIIHRVLQSTQHYG